jgi:uncharacterized protein YndB with AHSA1/START domain
MGTTKITAEPGLPYIDMSREFDAPRDLVYRAFTDPDLLAQWLGPRRLTMIVDKFDVRDGGAWRYIHREQDGTEYGFHGVFHGMPTPDAMVQTFEFEGAPGHIALDTIGLEERDGRTMLRGHSVYQSVEDRNAMVESGMESGLNEGFDRLEELLPSLLAAV